MKKLLQGISTMEMSEHLVDINIASKLTLVGAFYKMSRLSLSISDKMVLHGSPSFLENVSNPPSSNETARGHSRGRGRGRGHGRGGYNKTRQFDKDFDFERANAKFNKEEIEKELLSLKKHVSLKDEDDVRKTVFMSVIFAISFIFLSIAFFADH